MCVTPHVRQLLLLLRRPLFSVGVSPPKSLQGFERLTAMMGIARSNPRRVCLLLGRRLLSSYVVASLSDRMRWLLLFFFYRGGRVILETGHDDGSLKTLEGDACMPIPNLSPCLSLEGTPPE